MIEKEDKKRLFSNFFSLSILQAVNYILPLLTFPYLVKVLGVEYFGLLAFATAVIGYFNVITDYGFNLTATREISVHRDNKAKLIEIFSAVMSIKILLMFFSFLLLSILILSFEKFSKDYEVYFLTFGTVIGQVLFPIWFFQGMERMKYITYLNIVAKVMFTVAIFVFIQEKSDFYLVPLFSSLGFIIVGIWSLWIIYKKFNIIFSWQSYYTLKYYLHEGWYLFQSQFVFSLYRSSSTLFLGLLTNNTVVGLYAVAERIIVFISGFFIPANQAIYPYLAQLAKKSNNLFKKFIKKMIIIYLSISFVLFMMMITFSEKIIIFIYGSLDREIHTLFLIFALTIFSVPLSTLYGQVLIIQKLDKEMHKIIIQMALLYFIFLPMSIVLCGVYCMVIVVVFLQYYIVWRYFKIINKKG